MRGKFLLLMSLFVTVSCANEQDPKRPALGGNYSYDYQVNPEQLATTLDLFPCPICFLLFDSDYELNEHMFITPGCNMAFANGLVQHPQNELVQQPTLLAQAAANQNNFVCEWDQCNLSFNDKELFYNHVNQNHNRKNEGNNFVCKWQKKDGLICNKSCPTVFRFKDHIVTHTGEKPFICNICDQKFSSEKNCKAHQPYHRDLGNKTPYKCISCKMFFTKKAGLSLHNSLRHSN